MPTLSRHLSQYNFIFLEMDRLYRDTIRDIGLSESVFWILYTLRVSETPLTQAEIVNYNNIPPQTINSALKRLEQEGIVAIAPSSDRRKKLLTLTAQGEALAAKTADCVISQEIAALDSFQPEELRQFLGLYKKYNDALKVRFSQVRKEAL